MLITRDYEVILNVFYTPDEWLVNGKKDKVMKYLERKGWVQAGFWMKSCTYKGVKCSGRIKYTKKFKNEKQIEEELADINDAFNDGYLSGNEYSHTRVKHYDLEPLQF